MVVSRHNRAVELAFARRFINKNHEEERDVFKDLSRDYPRLDLFLQSHIENYNQKFGEVKVEGGSKGYVNYDRS